MPGIKAQGQVSEYHDFVIRGLVNIEGTSTSDVTARIIGLWIRENEEKLAKLGLSVDDWRRSSKPAPDNVISYRNKNSHSTASAKKSKGVK